MIELLLNFFDASGDFVTYVQQNPDLYDYLIKRAFETSCVFFIVIFLVFVYLFYLIFRHFWKS